MRARVLALCERFFPPGGRVVDLGCGVGLDAAALGALGYAVTGIDASAGMVEEAKKRAVNAYVGDLEHLQIGDDEFQGAISNFGAINCLPSLEGFAGALWRALTPGAHAVLVVINRTCLVENIALLRRGRRPRRRGATVNLEGYAVPMRYLTGRDLRTFSGFSMVHHEALGAFVAPPDLGGRPGLRTRIEPWFASLPLVRDLGDHTAVVLRREALSR